MWYSSILIYVNCVKKWKTEGLLFVVFSESGVNLTYLIRYELFETHGL